MHRSRSHAATAPDPAACSRAAAGSRAASRPRSVALAAALAVALAAAFSLNGAAPLHAQIGEAVGVHAGADGATEVLVLRPGDRLGRPALVVYRLDDQGTWRPSATLGPASPAAPYEGFTPSLGLGDRAVAVGAADAGGDWAARLYRRGDGGWAAAGSVPMDPASAPASAAAGSEPPAAVDMATLMRIMQPPPRLVALDPAGSTLAVWTAGPDADRVRVFSRGDGAGEWVRSADLAPSDGMGFGGPVALAADGDRVVVGASGRGIAGVVYVFERGPDGWAVAAELTGRALPPGARLGVAVALDGPTLAVGAPGAGRVLTFRRDAESWRAGPVLAPAGEDGAAMGASGFGGALALRDRDLWVGAPLTDHRAGAVHRFRRAAGVDQNEAGAEEWSHDGAIRARDLDAAMDGSLFGAAVALGAGRAVVGAPRAMGGNGRVAVFSRGGDRGGAGAWGDPAWIEAAPALEAVVDGEVRCSDGGAAGFDCRDVDLLAFLPLPALDAPGEMVSDLWGWADPETGREYALVGRTAGMAIVDVTRPSSPAVVALVRANPSGARDIKTYGHHAFMTGDGAGDHGLVIFDLTRLRDLPAGDRPITLDPDARYTGIGSAHNLIMDDESGIAIPVGASGGGQTCGGGFHMLDVTTPLEPEFLGCYTDTIGLIAPGRSHDGQCVVYHGPDDRYRERRICFASNETALRILDITDPADVGEVARAGYPSSAYTHQGWLTDDHRYFFMNDELDELVGLTPRTRTLIWDIAELDDPILVGEYLGPDGATDHNLFIRGNRMYQANYQAGFHLVDISDPENPVGLGSFDTTPYDGNPPGFGSGAWSAYPFLPSGTVLVSSMNEGLFLLRPRPMVP